MAFLTWIIDPDEALGLGAVVEPGTAARWGDPGSGAGALSKARVLMRTALAGKLEETGLPWAPSAEAAKKCVAEGRGAG